MFLRCEFEPCQPVLVGLRNGFKSDSISCKDFFTIELKYIFMDLEVKFFTVEADVVEKTLSCILVLGKCEYMILVKLSYSEVLLSPIVLESKMYFLPVVGIVGNTGLVGLPEIFS